MTTTTTEQIAAVARESDRGSSDIRTRAVDLQVYAVRVSLSED